MHCCRPGAPCGESHHRWTHLSPGRRLWTALLIATCGMQSASAGARPAVPAPGAQRRAAGPTPALVLPDLSGRPHRLAEFRGRPTALFFFCGCDPCHAVARLWGQVPPSPISPNVTLVVFLGDAPAARAFLAQTGMDPARTTVLLDPQDRAAGAYGVTVCPRVFVTGRTGRPVYTNNEPGRDPQTTPAASLVSRAVSALRTLPAGGAERPPQARNREIPDAR